MNVWYRFWVYLLPAPMWLAEFFMRTVMQNPDAKDFFPSSLAATALGLLIPALSPKKNSPDSHDVSASSRRDEAIRRAAMLTLFLGTFLWLATVYLSIGGTWPNDWIGASVDQKLYISVILYIVAFLLNEWKERI